MSTDFDLAIRTEADLDACLARAEQEPVIVFKHSTACPISARAHAEVERFLARRDGAKPFVAIVRVIEERALSRAIEHRLAVRHESPQALWVAPGRPVAHLSHGAITADSLDRWRGTTPSASGAD